jgi:hypothetical protein
VINGSDHRVLNTRGMEMSDYNMDVVTGERAPVLATALLAHVHALNRDYVGLLIAAGTQSADCMTGATLGPKVLDALARMDVRARRALAACPYTLFTFGFQDHRFWSAVLSDAGQQGALHARLGGTSVAPLRSAFTAGAIYLAWHVALSHRIAARVLFGMPEEVATQFAQAPLWRLQRVVLDYPELLAPRWPANPAFWPDLVRFAAARDTNKLTTTQLLGHQFIAAELSGEAPRLARTLRLRPLPEV